MLVVRIHSPAALQPPRPLRVPPPVEGNWVSCATASRVGTQNQPTSKTANFYQASSCSFPANLVNYFRSYAPNVGTTKKSEYPMEHIVFLEKSSIPLETQRSKPLTPHSWQAFPETPTELLEARLEQASIAIVNKTKLTQKTLEQAKNLKLISICATGFDNIDLAACRQLGIAVSNARNYAASSVSQHVISLILSLVRNLPAYNQALERGRWQNSGKFCFLDYPITDLAGLTLGIVGKGSIGSSLAKIAESFGMRVVFSSRKNEAETSSERMAFDDMLRVADIISLHCPLNEATKNLIGRDEIASMKQGAILINASRGGLVDEQALADSLESGHVGGAGIDCLSAEPPPFDNPLYKMKESHKLILTPHVAWASNLALVELWRQTIENIDNFCAGRAFNRVC